MGAATIRDVAARAGVAVGTVSNLITGTRYVRPETAERVRQAMAELGYRPNGVARGLRSNRTRTVGLVVPDNANPFFAEVAWHIEQVSIAMGFGTMICNTGGLAHLEASSMELLLEKRVDGIILVSTCGDLAGPEAAVAAGVPLVLIDREVGALPVDAVLVDNRQGGWLAAQHLLELGHRRVGCVAGPAALSSSVDRLEGFRDGLASAGVAVGDEQVVIGGFRLEDGYREALALLDRDPSMTAVFAANDLMALGVIRAAHDRGRAVPRDLSVVGFDGIGLSAVVVPRLTTVRQPLGEIARQAVETLTRRLADRERDVERLVLPVDLIVRESTARRVGWTDAGADRRRR